MYSDSRVHVFFILTSYHLEINKKMTIFALE